MLAGGIGSVRPQHALKDPDVVGAGSYLIVMGGPAMLIGLGGGAASSGRSGSEESADLDFASVQRWVVCEPPPFDERRGRRGKMVFRGQADSDCPK